MHPHRVPKTSGGITLNATVVCSVILALVGGCAYGVLAPVYRSAKVAAERGQDGKNIREIALAAIMYGGDYDDRIPLAINGRWSRLQNRHNNELTVNCPGPGAQDFPSADAAGAKPTRTWVELEMPYLKSREHFVSPYRKDTIGYFSGSPRSVSDKGYDAEGATYRNQGRFAFYGLNYMFLAPIRIPKSKLGRPDAINYAEGVSKRFFDADDPAGTVMFTGSQQAPDDPRRGFFVVNAPGMWSQFAKNDKGYVAFWDGNLGEWSRASPPFQGQRGGWVLCGLGRPEAPTPRLWTAT